MVYCFQVFVLNIVVTWQNRFNTLGNWRLHNPPILNIEQVVNNQDGRILTYRIGNIWVPYLYPFMTTSFATLFDYYHIGGYDPIVSKLNHRLTFGLNNVNSYEAPLNTKALDHLSAWSARYIVSRNTAHNMAHLSAIDQLNNVYKDDTILVFENSLAKPYAYFEDREKNKLPVNFKTNSIEIKTENHSPGRLIVTLAPLPFYHYYIDGVPKGSISTKDEPISIVVPANTNRVKIQYVDYPFVVGLIISITLWTLLVSVMLLMKPKKTLSPATARNNLH